MQKDIEANKEAENEKFRLLQESMENLLYDKQFQLK